MATVAQVRDRAANDLGILRLNQSLQAQDDTRITSAYNEVYADLQNEGLATWTSTGSIPAECVQHVAALVADNCLNTYGVSNDRYQRIKLSVKEAKREIRRLITPEFISPANPSDF